MPWTNVTYMEEINRFVILARSGRFTVTELCEQFGISRKTGYKHLERYAALGLAGPPLVGRNHAAPTTKATFARGGKKHRFFEFVVPPLGGKFDGFRLKAGLRTRSCFPGAGRYKLVSPHEVSRKVAAWHCNDNPASGCNPCSHREKNQSLTISSPPRMGVAGACCQAAFSHHEAAGRRATALDFSGSLRLSRGVTCHRSGEGGFAELDALRDFSHGV